MAGPARRTHRDIEVLPNRQLGEDAAVLRYKADSGARDAVTPPSFADRVAKQLPHSLHLIFPESSHGNFGFCGTKLIGDFIDSGSVEGLDVSCVSQQKPAKFTVNP